LSGKLPEILPQLTSLATLKLNSCNIDDKDLTLIAEKLPNLAKLFVGNNPISSWGIVDNFSTNHHLLTLF
jgi:hypothetical protein